MNLTAILDDIVGVPAPVRGVVSWLLGLNQVEALISVDSETKPIAQRVLDKLSITYRIGERDVQQIPRTGPVMVVANHPFGVLEGAVLATVLTGVRPDVRFLANDILSVIPEIRDLLIPVDPMSGQSAARSNASGLRRSIEFLRSGGCLVVFPAGEVSHFHPREAAVVDSEWNPAVARMMDIASRNGNPVSAVPVYISGSNSLLFQALGMIHSRLRTILLARELLNKRDRLVELRIGSPITNKKLLQFPTPKERTEYLRWRTYLLGTRLDYKAKTRCPLGIRKRQSPLRVAAPAADAELLSAEIHALAPEQLLAEAGDLDVYIAPASVIPSVLAEIGRLRELTFRAVDEGTGKAADLDRFDASYQHLFLWNAAKKEVVGAYRLAGSDMVENLYTATLFKYGDAFLDKLGPALELGRSFIRPEYQRGFVPLLALWKGIGTYVARNPRYKVLFGPVSISNQYQAISRELMVTFLERHASLREWMGLIANRNPLRHRSRPVELPETGFDVADLSDVISDLEPARTGIPVLLRQYLKLGGKLVGFNVDPEFSDALDGLIVVDLTKTEPRLLDRYLGKAEASEFLEYWCARRLTRACAEQ